MLRKAYIRFLLSSIFFISISADAQVTFIIGSQSSGTNQSTGFQHSSSTWEGNEGKSGYISEQTVDATSGATAQIALVSSPDVWFPSGDADYPLEIRMTDMQVISGPNIHIYNGFVIKSVRISLKNAYSNTLSDGNHDNFFSISIGGNSLNVGPNNEISSTYTVTTPGRPAPFSNLLQLPLIIERAAAIYFDRSVAGDRTAIQDVKLLAKIEITVEKVSQNVIYKIYRHLDNGTETPLLMGDYFLHPGNYDNNENNACFTDTVVQYAGQSPSLAPTLYRKGCLYGYDCAYIGVNESSYDGNGYYLVKTYFAVDNAQLPFQYSFPDFDPRDYSTRPEINTAIKNHNPEFRYNLTSKDIVTFTNGEEHHIYEKIDENKATAYKTSARTICFIGNPYNTILFSPDGTGSNNLNTLYYYMPGTSSDPYLYFGLLPAKESLGSTLENQYFAVRDNLPTNKQYVDYYYLGCGTSTTTTRPTSIIRGRQYSNSSSTSTTSVDHPSHYNIDPSDGAFYYTYSTGSTHVWPEGFMLYAEPRTEDKTLRFHQVYVDADGNRTADAPFHDLATGQSFTVYTNNAYKEGDPIVFPTKYQLPYYEYEYYTDLALTSQVTVVDASWTTQDIYVKMTWNGPFVFSSADDSNEHWYYLKLNSKLVSAEGYHPYKIEDIATATVSPIHLWKFVRNDDFTVTIKNRWFGNDYSLMRINKDYGRNNITAFNGYTGPVMRHNNRAGQPAIGDPTMLISDKWLVVRSSDDVFGLEGVTYGDRQSTSMNICDYRGTGMMRYFRNPANLQETSRLEVVPFGNCPVSSALLSSYVTRCEAQAGNPFGFKTSGITGNTDEEKLTNPDNYVRSFEGYYRIRLGNGSVNYAQVRANTTSSQDVENKNVITQVKARAWLTQTTAVPTLDDATAIFNFDALNDATSPIWNGHVKGETFSLNTAIAAPFTDVAAGYFNNCTVSIYPSALGEAIFVADSWDGGETHYGNGSDMILSHKSPTSSGYKLILESAYVRPTPFLIERITDYGVRMTQIGGSGPAYGSLYVPFDLVVPEGVTPYVASAINENEGTVTIYPATLLEGRVLPASTPVIIISNDDMASTTLTFAISGDTPSTPTQGANSAGNKFNGTYHAFTVPKINEGVDANNLNYFNETEHDVIRLFGKGGSANCAGFYAYTLDKHHNVPANRVILDNQDTNISLTRVATSVIMIVEENDSTGIITDVSAIITADGRDTAPEYYDLQGRRVLHPTQGIYIVKSPLLGGKGRKVVIE